MDWKGGLPLSKVKGLLSEDQALTATLLGEAAGAEMLRFHLARRLAHMVKATAEPLEFTPVQEGLTALFRRELWGKNAPFKVASSSGVVLETVSRIMVGVPDALINCVAEDQGDRIQVKLGGQDPSGEKHVGHQGSGVSSGIEQEVDAGCAGRDGRQRAAARDCGGALGNRLRVHQRGLKIGTDLLCVELDAY